MNDFDRENILRNPYLASILNIVMLKIKEILKPIFYWLAIRWFLLLERLFSKPIDDYKRIPIIINNRNRLTYLLELIERLEKSGYTNIYILDNDSEYPPLLEYYRSCKYKIVYLGQNLGHLALWKSRIYKQFIRNYYVYTDPDIVPDENCPDDFIYYFLNILKKHKLASKVGFSLKIDDLPDSYKFKKDVIEWESRWFEKRTIDNLYVSHIDTTFALYRPWARGGSHEFKLAYRTDTPYIARHLPWYEDSSSPNEENLFYSEHAIKSTFWTKKNRGNRKNNNG